MVLVLEPLDFGAGNRLERSCGKIYHPAHKRAMVKISERTLASAGKSERGG